MGVFEVGHSSFDDLSSFNHHLANGGRENITSDLYIVVGLSQFSQQKFFEILTQRGYSIEDFGAVQKISREYTTNGDIPDDTIVEEDEEVEEEDDESERIAEFYLYYDEETGVTLFYTDQRKTKEIKYTVAKLLDGEPGLHYLYIGPSLFRDIRREIIRNEEIAEITKFVADRLEDSDYPCRIRPDVERTIQYYGDDGIEALEEMEENYGVRPRNITFNVPNNAKFRITRKGVFSLGRGDLTTLFEYVELCIEKALEIKEAYGESEFQMLATTDSLSVPTSEPASIELSGHLEYSEVEKVKSRMNEEGYLLVDSFQQEGSLYFSSKVMDTKKKNRFRIKASENEIRVFPQETEENLGSFLRFHEFVQSNIDPDASVVVET
ncbi:hypothetical protein [Haloarchaeobius sp. DT45]|uniref:hypothetical protein n=1 Tax=Haloarchaeobius sp. DT45 TaxID=3446116 RepID=UPI003F6AE921